MRRLFVGLVAAAVFGGMVPAAQADERVCRGTIGKRTLDNVKVPQGATCTLKGTRVKGNIVINRGAVLEAINVRVNGNVQGENAKNVIVRAGAVVGGDVQVEQGRRGRVIRSRVGGNVQYESQRGLMIVRRVKVGGDVQAFQNKGGVRIRGNTIDGNLQCKANKPRPVGGNNKVGGNKEDQCKRL
jgi:hypothetical protein